MVVGHVVSLSFPSSSIGVSRSASSFSSLLREREREIRHFPTHPGLTAAATSSVSQGRESIEEEKVLSLSVVQCCQKVVFVKHFHFEMPNSI